MRKQRGFTLIELLVVIAVIVILAAILFPVFSQAREKARQVSCLSNLRQIGMGAMIYVQDYDETFPGGPGVMGLYYPGPEGSWDSMPDLKGNNLALISAAVRLMPYLKNKQVLVDPSDPNGDRINQGWDTRFVRRSYGWNGGISQGSSWPDFPRAPGHSYNPGQPLGVAQITKPALLYLCGDTPPLPIHSRLLPGEARFNYLYADGHAKFTRWLDTWLPLPQEPFYWSLFNPQHPLDVETPCSPTCADAAARDPN